MASPDSSAFSSHTMAKLSHLPPMHSLSLALLSFLLLLSLAAAVASNSSRSAGFSLKLIHRDSDLSPFSPHNLTASQWFQRQVEFTKSYLNRLQSPLTATAAAGTDKTPRPTVGFYEQLYMVNFKIGSPGLDYFLLVDTSTDLSWTQCEGCNPCHDQMNVLFNPENSSTYANIQCDDPLCKPPYVCFDGRCTYTMNYATGSSSLGVLATETFTFLSNTGEPISIPKVLFGCSFQASDQFFNGFSAGVMGLGGGDLSFPVQLKDQFKSRFSYCLVGWPNAKLQHSYLRFGDDIPIEVPVTALPFVQTNYPTRYYLNLLGISVNGVDLHIPASVFTFKKDGSDGFFIDSGAPLTILKREAYDIVKNGLVLYFFAYHLERAEAIDKSYPVDLCYKMPKGFQHLPYFTFHFDTGDYRVEPMQMFHIDDENSIFCLAVLPGEVFSLLGAMQQANHRLTYDLGHQRLVYSPLDCSKEAD